MSQNIIREIIDNNTDVFEQMVLACVLKDPDFYFTFKTNIGYHSNKAHITECKDFTLELDNTIYNVISQYYEVMSEGGMTSEVKPCTWDWVQQIIFGLVANGQKPDGFKMNLEPRFSSIKNFDHHVIRKTVTNGITYWLEQKRSRKVLTEVLNTNQDLPGIMRDLQLVQQQAQITEAENDDFTNATITDEDENSLDFIPGPLDTLNVATSGGFARGECVGVVAPQGAGKTVFATQHANHYALNTYNTLFISTEQPIKKLFPRFVTMSLDIPFKEINRGVHLDKIKSPEKVKQIQEYQKTISQHLKIRKWDKNVELAQGLEPMIARYTDEGFAPDVVIVDWIGGGLGQSRSVEFLRHYYQEAADKLADISYQYNIVTMYFAQAHVFSKGKNKYVSDQNLNECKSMMNNSTWGIGISALESKDVAEKQQNIYEKQQYLNPFKTRMSAGFLIEVHRDFGYQRFIDPKAKKSTGNEFTLTQNGYNSNRRTINKEPH